MPTWRTPWANTLPSTGPIFIHNPSESKLSQVAGYVAGVARQGSGFVQLVFEASNSSVRGPATGLPPARSSGEVP